MKLSKNLSLKEVIKSNTALRKGIDNLPNGEHQLNLITLANHVFQPIREHFQAPIYISSGYRSEALNEAIGGSKTSQHSKGQAIDIDNDAVDNPSNMDIFCYIRDYLVFDQLIFEFPNKKGEPSWVHVSYIDEEKYGRKNRNQILVAKKNSNNQTYYENYKR